ncbi:ABC transporter ATP-binding protein [Patescibacteria group bacterium]|nr:ABC transporter ATP-binding protein [Patescibacteria group bacterium]
MEEVIRVENLTKRYGEFTAVHNISFAVKKGEIFGLLGENGAGKTTTLEIIEGLRKLTAGTVTVLGHDVKTDPTSIKSKIGVQLQSSAYFSYLTLKEMLELFASFYGKTVDAAALLHQVRLEEKAGAYVTQLSGGQRQRFSIMASLVNNPEIVFLDEPTTGLDPLARRNLWELIRTVRDQGKTVVLTTHYLEEAEILCDRVAIMEKGEMVALDKTGRLIAKAEFPYALTFEAQGDIPAALEKLSRYGQVHAGEKAGHHYRVLIKKEGDLGKVIDIMRPLKVEGLALRPASLEDVFIQLTGKAIDNGDREEERA